MAKHKLLKKNTTMREKPIAHKTLERYIDYLNKVKNLSDYNNDISLIAVARMAGVSNSVAYAIVKLNIVKPETKTSWEWITEETDLKKLALQVLDYLLHQNKKAIHIPIAGMESIATTLNDISERLVHITTIHERGLKTAKTAPQTDGDIFRIDEQRLKIACAIASGIYADPTLVVNCTQLNDTIVAATEDLMNKLLKRGN